MELGLKNKVIMVEAASKGLGFGIAQAVAQEGARVSIGSRTEADILAAADTLRRETGAETLGSVLDARDAASISNWVETTVAKFGGVDGLVVNAGGPPAGGFDDFDDAAWQAAFELTMMSSVRMIRAVLPHLRARGGGSILAVTSSSVKEPIDILLLSNVMRSGVVSLLKSLSRELAPEQIRVNNLVPGRILTDRVKSLDTIGAKSSGRSVAEQQAMQEAQIPWGRYGTIEEFGKAGAFLLSEAASYITGETLIVDGGAMKTVW
ncbi:SDR family oxidoreductase [Candidatus Leptofilum sp.]|uniref:SDR family oxidoreductase n=1 Tax=Candidatus Leptofilum sp. TaxID=3241576 RepID=UPI003B58C23E